MCSFKSNVCILGCIYSIKKTTKFAKKYQVPYLVIETFSTFMLYWIHQLYLAAVKPINRSIDSWDLVI